MRFQFTFRKYFSGKDQQVLFIFSRQEDNVKRSNVIFRPNLCSFIISVNVLSILVLFFTSRSVESIGFIPRFLQPQSSGAYTFAFSLEYFGKSFQMITAADRNVIPLLREKSFISFVVRDYVMEEILKARVFVLAING